ncbi:HlyD family secretion protein, partial [Rhizobium johnstonii]
GAEAELAKAKEQLGPSGNDNPQLRSALAALEKARLDLVRTTVQAPSAGVLTNLQLTIGKVLSAGQSAMTFIDVGTIWITATFSRLFSLKAA